MATLTKFLQYEFAKSCPPDWEVKHESHFLTATMERLLGYAPRADVLLTKRDGTRRLWVEFEVSRADPVANHAKFATGHLFAPLPETDTFVSMVSSHVERGRRNLAANAILLMRKVGIDAFQIPLLPTVAPERIKALNHSALASLTGAGLDVGAEIDRCLTLPQSVFSMNGHKILFASNTLEVLLNVERWNYELQTSEGKRLWGRRRGQYFVFSPASGLFAPAKFCAFTASETGALARAETPAEGIGGFMPLRLYASLGESEPRFDGNIAWKHLVNNLGFRSTSVAANGALTRSLSAWLADHVDCLSVREREVVVLTPPAWC